MIKTFTGAMLGYFGRREGQQASDFAGELKSLSYEEKLEFHRMLTEQAGIACHPPTIPVVVRPAEPA
jgi:hypothetical protein